MRAERNKELVASSWTSSSSKRLSKAVARVRKKKEGKKKSPYRFSATATSPRATSPRTGAAPKDAHACSGCATPLLSDSFFCTKCGKNVKEAAAQFCGLCSSSKVAGKSAGTLVCPSCEPDSVGPVQLSRRSMAVNAATEKDASMKLHLTQGTLLNVSSASKTNAKLIKVWCTVFLFC